MTKSRYYILWILILAAILRFVQIEAPPVGRHAWRQCDTASVARNFHEHGYQLLYPQIDWEVPGFVEMEFPLFPWSTALLYGVFGQSETLARLLAVLGSLVTIAFLYLIVARILGKQAAVWSAFFYSVLPLNLFFGRAIMPEPWMLAATAAAVYFFLRWTEEESWLFYLLAVVATTLACLLKLTALYLGLPLLWLAWQEWGSASLRKWQIWAFATSVTVPLILWYGHAYNLGQEFGASFNILTAAGSDKWGTWHLLLDPEFYNRVFIANLGGRMLTWAAYPVFLVGLFLKRKSPREHLFDVWLLAVVVVLLLASGGTFRHDYYSLPLLLPAAVFVGKAFDRGWNSRKALLAIVVVSTVILSGYRHAGVLAEEREPNSDLALAGTLASQTEPDDLVVSCNARNPVWLYHAARRGWGRDCSDLNRADLDQLIEKGARYLVARGGDSAPFDPSPRLSQTLDSFFEVRKADGETFLVNLDSPRRLDDLSWTTALQMDLTDPAFLESWETQGGVWQITGAGLVGTRFRHSAEARSDQTLPACGICRVQMAVTLLSPSSREAPADEAVILRGRGRPDASSSINLWWKEDKSGLALTLATKSGAVALHQFEHGVRRRSTRVEHPLQEGRKYELDLRSDGFEIEVLIDGQVALTTAYEFTDPPAGRLTLRPRFGSIQVDSFKIELPSDSSAAP